MLQNGWHEEDKLHGYSLESLRFEDRLLWIRFQLLWYESSKYSKDT